MLHWREGLLYTGDLIFLECGYFTTHVHSTRIILTPDDYVSHCPRLHVSAHQGGARDTKICPSWFRYDNDGVSIANGVYMSRTAFAQQISSLLGSLLY